MNILLAIGFLLIIGYASGWLLERWGLPKIIGYMATGIIFSPHTINFLDPEITSTSQPILKVCLSFIAFEVGGALKWEKVQKHEKEIISITLLASVFPYFLIAGCISGISLLFPGFIPYSPINILCLSLILGALASPTDPTATFAVMHQFRARGKVSDTIVGVAALDDALGILIFSFTLGLISIFIGPDNASWDSPLIFSLYQIGAGILLGIVLGYGFQLISRFFKSTSEGQWVVIVLSLLIFCAGLAQYLKVDEVLASMSMGIFVVNKCNQQKLIFKILERYTEEIIFLFFFLLSGLYLNIATIPKAFFFILLFIILRTLGKYLGSHTGARFAKAAPVIQKNTAGGLIPQGGIVIGLVLSVYQDPLYKEISDILLTTIMGTSIINELIGPVAAKYSLKKSGELRKTK
ncbi:cation:proton antiporter [Echinicola jeungdonensis]|uniref:Cation:proton antiporter n=1 Tax=Echinicola jeungdonensis TaxID=709343 RepID=A0ABV5J8H3_9BACT|nr:cation:proton antiporter [Echinicola jeungdonensis]MDN3669437.1 cation:proton antiporter [Echinicola jeungdonensis]